MKLIVAISIVIILLAVIFTGSDIFMIMTQELGMKQWVFIFIFMVSTVGLIVLHAMGRHKDGLLLFFIVYPFISQAAYYINISGPFFIITPALLYLTIYLFLTKEIRFSLPWFPILLFAASTLIGVIASDNINTAVAFFILGVGSFVITSYVIYLLIKNTSNPMETVQELILAIIFGSLIYFVIESLAFRITLNDVKTIVTRNWSQLSSEHYYTGGYREPAGLAFVCAELFWIVLFFMRSGSSAGKGLNRRWIQFAFLVLIFFLAVTGTRSAIITIALILILLVFFRKQIGFGKVYRVNIGHIFIVLALVGVGAFVLVPRTFLTSRSIATPAWITPYSVSLGSSELQLVGTTPYYFQRTFSTLKDLAVNPWGTGPFNASPTEYELFRDKTGPIYHYSLVSNLFVIGATFGWLSMLIWLIFVTYLLLVMLNLWRGVQHRELYALTMIFMVVILASLMPGGYYLGPNVNWSEFNRFLPISPTTPGVPTEYPSIISGVIFGCFLGFLAQIRKASRAKLNATTS
jgi:hypothetical protein